ncbi:DUF1934 domain-containing protein [Virgibacillus kekensis]|uniref:DUF1934 domain-containing protein n=1 Tax=Virgibacillus kekensis TaxID=202261 RepID=A0ABV9DH32_9BACI
MTTNAEPLTVAVELKTVIDDNGQMEYNTVNETGQFYRKNNLDVIKYEETDDNGSPVKNLITIQPEKVNVKRLGALTMNQQFRMKETTENILKHPYGNIHMETFTETMEYRSITDTHEGQLELGYSVKMNGQDPRRHQLTLTIKKEVTQ